MHDSPAAPQAPPALAQRLLAVGAIVAGLVILIGGSAYSVADFVGIPLILGLGLSLGWTAFLWGAGHSLWTESPMAPDRTAFLELVGGLLMVASYLTLFQGSSTADIRLFDWIFPAALLIDGARRYFGSRGV